MHAVAGFIAANTTTRTLTKDRKRRPCSFSVLQSQKFFIAATTGAGQSLSQTERFNSERTDCGRQSIQAPARSSRIQCPAAALHLVVGNTEEVLDHLRQQRVGLGLVEGHQRSPGVRLEQFMPDEIVPVCAPRIPDPKLRRAIEGLKSVRNLEALLLIWRESGSGTRAVVESVSKDSGVNPRKLDQRFELG